MFFLIYTYIPIFPSCAHTEGIGRLGVRALEGLPAELPSGKYTRLRVQEAAVFGAGRWKLHVTDVETKVGGCVAATAFGAVVIASDVAVVADVVVDVLAAAVLIVLAVLAVLVPVGALLLPSSSFFFLLLPSSSFFFLLLPSSSFFLLLLLLLPSSAFFFLLLPSSCSPRCFALHAKHAPRGALFRPMILPVLRVSE